MLPEAIPPGFYLSGSKTSMLEVHLGNVCKTWGPGDVPNTKDIFNAIKYKVNIIETVPIDNNCFKHAINKKNKKENYCACVCVYSQNTGALIDFNESASNTMAL